MGLFSKKRDNKPGASGQLPELPKLPKLPEFSKTQTGARQPVSVVDSRQNTSQERYMLPSFPKSESANKLSMQAVKDAVKSDDEYNHVDGPQGRFVQQSFEEGYVPRFSEKSEQAKKRTEPVFVRLDKFQNAVENFEEIKERLKQIEGLFSEIKQMRKKEDAEFSEWEKDLKLIKSRLDSIDKTLFKQLD